MVTRFFIVILLPLIGFSIDSGSSKESFILLAHTSLILATGFGVISLVMANMLLKYFGRVVNGFASGGNFIGSFIRPAPTAEFQKLPKFRDMIKNNAAIRTFWQSNIVYLIYSTGLFISFYFALIFPDYSVSISQMSGVVNAFGAVLLTFLVEPRISRSIDRTEDNPVELIFALYWGRLFATGLTGQIALMLLFLLS